MLLFKPVPSNPLASRVAATSANPEQALALDLAPVALSSKRKARENDILEDQVPKRQAKGKGRANPEASQGHGQAKGKGQAQTEAPASEGESTQMEVDEEGRAAEGTDSWKARDAVRVLSGSMPEGGLAGWWTYKISNV